ncbi:hypothetical protein FZC76_20275 [Sutcliffiella horikoshii]|uniref:Uncharacterized protein n=1 Tax=Sutcliffiella horikoshii TaxID=79883 RepID=A0A5D4SGH0_9BACI|nr:hypothetical protein [Sutcliffiella horikoshii]TYS62575.1 hypothetical protein FZC76_20275 [Sutcliffiella horikoshii]
MRVKNNNLLPIPKLYDQTKSISSNQQEFRKNYLEDILKEQEKTNLTISKTVSKINNNLHQSMSTQENNHQLLLDKLYSQEKGQKELSEMITTQDLNVRQVYEKVLVHEKSHEDLTLKLKDQDRNYAQLLELIKVQSLLSEELQENIASHVESSKKVDQRLNKLEVSLEEEKLLSQATLDQLAFQEDLTRCIHTKLEKYEELYEDIQLKLHDQEHFYQEINNKLLVQEMFHKSLMERMDSQDIASQKIADQLNTLRQTLVDKLENAITSIDSKYKQTLHYLSGSMFGLKERIIQKAPLEIESNEAKKVEVKQE